MDKENVVYVCIYIYTHIHTHTYIYTHTHRNIIQLLKKIEILPLVTRCMDFEGIMLSEISQTEKDKYHMILFICGILKKKKQNKQTNKLIDTEDGLMPDRGGDGGEMG